MIKKLIPILLVLIISVAFVYSINITTCATEYTINSPGNYNVTTNLNAGGTGNCIIINSNHVDLNCNGFSIINGDNAGINIYDNLYSDNITIKNCNIGNFDTGIVIGIYNYNISFENINISNTTYGVYSNYGIDYTSFKNMVFTNNLGGFYNNAEFSYVTYENILFLNNFNGFYDNTGMRVNSRFNNLTFYNSTIALQLYQHQNNTFSNINSYNSSIFQFYLSSKNIISNINSYSDNSVISLLYSENNTFSNLNMYNYSEGFSFSFSSNYNKIINSSFNPNSSDSIDVSISQGTPSYNLFYGNNMSNSSQIIGLNAVNYWNTTIDGVPVGNYWRNSDFICSNSQIVGDYEVCIVENYNLGSGNFDYGPIINFSFSQPSQQTSSSSSLNSIFPVQGIFSMILSFSIIFGYLIFS